MGSIESASELQPTVVEGALRPATAISWGAILGGAAATAALSLILLSLGVGLGLSSISPWTYSSASSTALAAGTIIWLLLTSGFASGLGGYIAGRLRARWPDADADEAHFRDTAHGFLAWAVATVISAGFLANSASTMIGAVTRAGVASTAVAGAAATNGASGSPSTVESRNYFADMMLRSDKPAEANTDVSEITREVNGILANASAGEAAQGDKTYLAQLVANRTGLSRADSEQRVAQTIAAARLAADAAAAKAKEVAETARKAAAYTALWIFVALLVGAFYASLAATWGGKQRDPKPYSRSSI